MEELVELNRIVDTAWVLISTSLVFLMQGGFMMLEIGAVREKNAKSSLVKKILQIGISTTAWWIIGFPLAYCGVPWDPKHYSRVFADGIVDWTFVICSWSFCATSTTIISGCIAERATLKAYLILSLLICTIVYPIVVRATWSKNAVLRGVEWAPWLNFEDFAGGAVVHMLGGIAGLVFAWRVGPRVGRFRNKEKERLVYRMEPHSVFLMGAGTIVLWFGWYGLCAGSTKGLSDGGALTAGRVFMTVSLSPAAASLSVAMLTLFNKKSTLEPSTLCNSVLSGLVSITSPCACVDAWAAMAIGFIGGLVFMAARRLLERIGVDDPLGAFAVHGACGAWGCLAVGIFGAQWSTHPSSFSQFASQVVGVLGIGTWTAGFVLTTLLILERLIPLRVTLEQELRGLDEELFTGSTRGGSEISSPEGRVAIVVTDVQGSTSLWAFDQRAMAQAITIHDDIMRMELANYSGYEIGTEGDAFQVAFSTTIDALGFCISVQQRLLEATWPARIMEHQDAQAIQYGDQEIFNGLRVRMGVDVGFCKRVVHQTSRTFRYVGVAMDTAKTIVDCLPSGGIIAVTHRTLEEVGPRIAKMGGLLSVCDLGTHLLKASSTPIAVFAVTHQDVALRVPLMKALETHTVIRSGYLDAPAVQTMHKVFREKLLEDDTVSKRRSSASFGHQFSFHSNRQRKIEMKPLDEVVICFASLVDLRSVPGAMDSIGHDSDSVSTSAHRSSIRSEKGSGDDFGLPVPAFERKVSTRSHEQHYRECVIEAQKIMDSPDTPGETMIKEVMAAAGKMARTALWQLRGYECKEDKYVFMTAFASAGQAVQWASTVASAVQNEFGDHVSFACGLHTGLPTEVKPNQATGRADYYGTLVNTAARIHALARKAAERNSCVYTSSFVRDLPDAEGDSVHYASEGSHVLKGLKTPVDIYSVKQRKPVMLSDDIFASEAEMVIPASPGPNPSSPTGSIASDNESLYLWGATDSGWNIQIVREVC